MARKESETEWEKERDGEACQDTEKRREWQRPPSVPCISCRQPWTPAKTASLWSNCRPLTGCYWKTGWVKGDEIRPKASKKSMLRAWQARLYHHIYFPFLSSTNGVSFLLVCIPLNRQPNVTQTSEMLQKIKCKSCVVSAASLKLLDVGKKKYTCTNIVWRLLLPSKCVIYESDTMSLSNVSKSQAKKIMYPTHLYFHFGH